MNIDMYNFMF